MNPDARPGDFATLCYPSDRYPLIVVGASASGKTIQLVRLNYRIVSGSFRTGDEVVEYWMPDFPSDLSVREAARLTARWSEKRQRYTINGTPVAIGHARFYQSPEV